MTLSVIQERRSIREYEDKEVPENLIQELIRAAQFAPTGMNNRAVEFVVLRSQEAKAKLFDLLEPKQPFVREAPLLIIPVTNTPKVPLIGLDQTIVVACDLAIASSFVMTQAVALGLGTVWKHIPAAFAPSVVKAFGIPEHYTLINALAVGYPKKKLPAHQESEFSKSKIHQEKW